MNIQRVELQKRQSFLQGFLFGLIPAALFFFDQVPGQLTNNWRLAAGLTTLLLLGTGAAMLFRRPVFGKIFICLGMSSGLFLLYPVLVSTPLATLSAGILSITALYYLFRGRISPFSFNRKELYLVRFSGSALALLLLTIFSPLFVYDHAHFPLVCQAGILIMLYTFSCFLNVCSNTASRKWLFLLLLGWAGLAALLAHYNCIAIFAFLTALSGFIYAVHKNHSDLKYLSVIINHPGRSVFLTFALLCASGTLLLRTPAAMTDGIDVIDAAFTAVSGVCVTGLSVIDIAEQLTLTGRFFLMLLIQAGGLGIMTLATLVLHTLGKRLSLDQEQLMSEITSEQEQDVFQSLKQIVKVTFFCEAAGALLLTPCFLHAHGNWAQALELGIFTSISAFCNAGFFPNAENMVPYSGNYFILIVTALLIIAGGIAPAVTVSLLRAGKKRKSLPLVSKLVIGGTAAMLAGSTFFLLLFEWNGIFSGLTSTEKVVNGFFLAASLRTAGFNTVAMAGSGIPAIMIMLLCMFIGGSPGGTAGGVKVTTLAIIVLTLRAAIRGDETVELDRHRIPGKSIIHAVAIFSSATFVLLSVIIMLLTTQNSGAKELIFETFSALGTVGLSLGATAELDGIGKIIIMATMFIGRIGPLTLFLLLSDRKSSQAPGYPPVRIPLG